MADACWGISEVTRHGARRQPGPLVQTKIRFTPILGVVANRGGGHGIARRAHQSGRGGAAVRSEFPLLAVPPQGFAVGSQCGARRKLQQAPFADPQSKRVGPPLLEPAWIDEDHKIIVHRPQAAVEGTVGIARQRQSVVDVVVAVPGPRLDVRGLDHGFTTARDDPKASQRTGVVVAADDLHAEGRRAPLLARLRRILLANSLQFLAEFRRLCPPQRGSAMQEKALKRTWSPGVRLTSGTGNSPSCAMSSRLKSRHGLCGATPFVRERLGLSRRSLSNHCERLSTG